MHYQKPKQLLPLSTLVFALFSFYATAQAEDAAAQHAQDYFAAAVNRLEASNSSQTQADKAIRDANKLRKEIIALRASSRKTADPKAQAELKQSADRLAVELKRLQAEGADLRADRQAFFIDALELFEQGLVTKWGARIKSRTPILMGDSTTLYFAHNTRIRSVHPKMLNRLGTPADAIDEARLNTEMSILVPALAAQNAPPELDISSFQISREQQYIAHIEVDAAQTKREVNDGDPLLVPPNTIHRWLLMLSDLQGEPVTNANVEIVGHMPGHVHGLPTEPRVTTELAAGIYLVEGVKFQMQGWWVMQFNIREKDRKKDSVTFNLVL